MDWTQLKNKVYYSNGSLRDIYVLNTTREDWEKWTDYVNDNYRVSWQRNESDNENKEDKINFEAVAQYWDASEYTLHPVEAHPAAVFIDGIQLNIFFFTEDEIENDICPSEIKSLVDHYKLMSYMQSVSKLLNKDVLLTKENYQELEVLIRVSGDSIFFT